MIINHIFNGFLRLTSWDFASILGLANISRLGAMYELDLNTQLIMHVKMFHWQSIITYPSYGEK